MSEDRTREVAADPRRRRKLAELHPRWAGYDVLMPGVVSRQPVYRFGVGLEIDCPAHDYHRITLFFQNPSDGEPRVPNQPRYYFRIGEEIQTLSIVRADRNYEWVTTDHWSGYIASGYVVDGFRFG